MGRDEEFKDNGSLKPPWKQFFEDRKEVVTNHFEYLGEEGSEN
jgi:hypothetical protein